MNSNYKFEDGITVNVDSMERAKEKHSKIIKCEHCKGTGVVQIAPNVRGIKKCPYCGGQSGVIFR